MAITVIMQDSRPDGAGGTYKKGSTYSLPDTLATYFIDIGLAKRTSTRSEQTGLQITGDSAGRFPSAPAQDAEETLKVRRNSDQGVVIVTKRRKLYPLNRIVPTTPFGLTQTLGVVTDTPGARHTLTSVATASGTTARIMGALTIAGLDTSKWYEASISVDAVFLQAPAAMSKGWFGLSTPPTAGAQEITMATRPEAGKRYSIRFQPSAASMIVRVGIGLNQAETVVSGDTITFADLCLYEVASATDVVEDYSYSAFGPVGRTMSDPVSVASCLYAIGDSWTNDVADWAGTLASTYGRETVVTATGGHTLAMMRIKVEVALAAGSTFLNRPARNAPGVWIITGGINDVIADASFSDIAARAQWLIDAARSRGAIPIFVLQPFASNSIHYTAGRAAIRAAFATYISREGVDFIDLQTSLFLNADGTANATYMLDETGAWIHATATGVTYHVGLVEVRLKEHERANRITLGALRWP